jgi:hypothetical protein
MMPTRTVQLRELTERGPKTLGTLTLTFENLVEAVPEAGGEQAVQFVMGRPVTFPDMSVVTKEQNPEKWFNRLPFEYHGSYFWASFE